MARADSTYRFGEFSLVTGRRSLERDGEQLEIQPKAYETLLYFVRAPDRVVTKDELLQEVWGGAIVTEDVLTRVVSALRKILQDRANTPRFIRAVRGVGYRFVAPVEVDEEAQALEPAAKPMSLAVLPFRSLSERDRDETLEFGLADTLIARLGLVPDLVVRPLRSTLALLDQGREPLDVARSLGADAILDASLQLREGRLRVNARLLATADGRALWSSSLDEDITGVFQLQDSICNRIVTALLPRFGAESARAMFSRPGTPAGYRSFLEGRVFMARYTAPDIRRALARFEAALDVSPDHAEAWASLGECHELIASESEDDAEEHYAAARRAARRALALMPGMPEAEALLAKIAWQRDWDWARAASGFKRAIAGVPHRAEFHIHCSDFRCLVGQVELGIQHAMRAVELDPVSPWNNVLLAQAYYFAERFDEAIAQTQRALELAPGFPFAELFAGLARFVGGDHERGIELVERASRSGRRDVRGALGVCLGLAGRRERAAEVLADLERGPPAPPFAMAIAHLGCGQLDEAGPFLSECVERRDWHVLLLCVDPLFASFRSDRRVRDIVRQLDLPDPRG